jgi:hypothetical protein
MDILWKLSRPFDKILLDLKTSYVYTEKKFNILHSYGVFTRHIIYN